MLWLLFEDFRMKKIAFSLIFLSFGPSNKSGLGKSWQIVDFMFTFEDFWFFNGLSIKRTSPERGHFCHAPMVSTL